MVYSEIVVKYYVLKKLYISILQIIVSTQTGLGCTVQEFTRCILLILSESQILICLPFTFSFLTMCIITASVISSPLKSGYMPGYVELS